MEKMVRLRRSMLCLLGVPLATWAAGPEPSDTAAVARAVNQTLEKQKTGSRTRWSGGGDRYGFITITRTYFPQRDQPCRDYTRTIHNTGREPTRLRGTGCRDEATGHWVIYETHDGEGTGGSRHRNPNRSPE